MMVYYKGFVPNARSKDQIAISFWLDSQLLRDIDIARGRKDRSQFIREAIAEKLTRMGIRIPESLIYAPARAKVISIVGDNNRNISIRAAEKRTRFRIKKGKK